MCGGWGDRIHRKELETLGWPDEEILQEAERTLNDSNSTTGAIWWAKNAIEKIRPRKRFSIVDFIKNGPRLGR